MQTIDAPVPLLSAPTCADNSKTDHFQELSVRTYAFGPFLLQPERQSLLKDGGRVRIGGRALDLLTALVERAGELVDKRELMSHVWPKIFVEEGNLKVNVAGLRRALGESPVNPQYIATVAGRGYRFIASVRYSGPRGLASGGDRPPGATRITDQPEAIQAIGHELEASRTAA